MNHPKDITTTITNELIRDVGTENFKVTRSFVGSSCAIVWFKCETDIKDLLSDILKNLSGVDQCINIVYDELAKKIIVSNSDEFEYVPYNKNATYEYVIGKVNVC